MTEQICRSCNHLDKPECHNMNKCSSLADKKECGTCPKYQKDIHELGDGYRLNVEIEASERVHLELKKDNDLVWKGRIYKSLEDAESTKLIEEFESEAARHLPPSIIFNPKILLPILWAATEKFRVQKKPLDIIDQALEITVKHDGPHRKLTILSLTSMYGPNPLNLALKGATTTGKSWLLTQAASFFPKEDVITYSDASPTSFFWKHGQILCKEHGAICPSDPKCKAEKYKEIDLTHRSLIILDQPNDAFIHYFKPVLSHDQKIITRLVTDSKKVGNAKAQEIRLKGWPSFLYASCQHATDSEIASRCFLISPDDSPEKINLVMDFQTKKSLSPTKWRTEYEEHPRVIEAKKLIRDVADFTKKYDLIEVAIPYGEILQEKFKDKFPICTRLMRAYPQLLGLIEALTLLNFKQRKNVVNNDDSLTLTSTIEDGEDAMKILEPFLEGIKYGLSTDNMKVYNEIITPLINKNGPISADVITRDFSKRKNTRVGVRSVRRHYLDPLLECGLLCEKKNPDDLRKILYDLNEKQVDHGGGSTPENNSGVGNKDIIDGYLDVGKDTHPPDPLV